MKQLFQDLNKAKEADEVGQAVKRNEDKILEIGKLFQQRGDAESLGQLVKMVIFLNMSHKIILRVSPSKVFFLS